MERESLSDRDLNRLRAALADEIERYQFDIRNYPPERMEKYGAPFLAKLKEKMVAVEQLIRNRTNDR